MSGSEVAALVVAVAATVALGALLAVVVALLRTVRDLRATVAALRVESQAVVEELCRRGHAVRALCRTAPSTLARGVEVVPGVTSAVSVPSCRS